MNTVSFVFQNSRLVKDSVLENVRMGKQDATREEVMDALGKTSVYGYNRKTSAKELVPS